MLQLVTIPCLSDNYAFLVHNAETRETACFDVPEAAPILAALADRRWTLTDIVLTHHHDDHIQGVPELVAATGARVTGAATDAHRLPPLDRAVAPGEQVTLCGTRTDVIDVSGHTVGHVAYHLPEAAMVFTGDSLMALGCGRLFEGTAPMMWASLSRLAALPPETTVCSGHEYTASNARFARTIEPGNPALISRIAAIEAARAEGRPTVPSMLGEELETNPFLRADHASVKAALHMVGAEDAAVFGAIRTAKDRF
ncbi:hydroxyacylglutathione hydrolase [Frigidibacter sp.]|uniref:hydroxyacylglutathione hydrolase n=1 Tax=Frigidibacter sp. TaxID=2586418 RepID=UPI0027329974|nr:hydroxyacylglutathione hydrolase [Frigidibacter sp.]MDP3341183.1 hydroxyacylglutathione hydrolase [Frigidibacter sp.]